MLVALSEPELEYRCNGTTYAIDPDLVKRPKEPFTGLRACFFALLGFLPEVAADVGDDPAMRARLRSQLRSKVRILDIAYCQFEEFFLAEAGRVLGLVERFDRRGTEPFELFRSECGQNSVRIMNIC